MFFYRITDVFPAIYLRCALAVKYDRDHAQATDYVHLQLGYSDQQSILHASTEDGTYAGYYRALAASILDGQAFPVTPRDAVDVMTIIELAIQSDAEGRRIAFLRQLN